MSIYIKVINRILSKFFFSVANYRLSRAKCHRVTSRTVPFDGKSVPIGYPSSSHGDDDDASRVSRNFVRIDVPRRCRIWPYMTIASARYDIILYNPSISQLSSRRTPCDKKTINLAQALHDYVISVCLFQESKF